MEIFLTILRYAAGPLLGALIGYFTNWLAVRMLFRPYYPKKIGKLRLPFTPGIIPKRKAALAKAVGKAVGEQLFTKDDLTSAIVSDKAKSSVGDYAAEWWKSIGEKSLKELAEGVVSEEKGESILSGAEDFISDKIYGAVKEVNLGGVVASEGVKVINQKKASLGMLAMFLSNDLVASLADKLSDGVNAYVEENGKQIISAAVEKEFSQFYRKPLSVLTQKIDESVIKNVACTLYERGVKSVFDALAKSLDVSAIVEDKMNAMDIKELEKLVLSVMKKELNAIVNLGALIGLLLGVVMSFI